MKMLFIILFFNLWAHSDFSISGRSLKDVSSIAIPEKKGQDFAVMVFQKDCTACLKQVQDLACLKMPVYLIGAFATEKDLRQELKKMNTSYPAIYGDKDVLKKLNIKKSATPQLFLYKANIKHSFLGLNRCEEIKSSLDKKVKRG